jgi:hypothetical protein
MTTGEQVIAAAIVAAGTGLGATIKIVAGRIARAIDASTRALVANAAESAALMERLGTVLSKIDGIGDFVEEFTPVRTRPRVKTPAGGVRGPRPGTHHDE